MTKSPARCFVASANVAMNHPTAGTAAAIFPRFSLPMAYGTANRTTSQPSAATGTSPRYQEWWNAPTTPSARPSSASMPYAAPASAPAAGPGGAGVAASPPAATGAVSSVMRPRLADAGEQVGLQEARSAQTALPGGHARHPQIG